MFKAKREDFNQTLRSYDGSLRSTLRLIILAFK